MKSLRRTAVAVLATAALAATAGCQGRTATAEPAASSSASGFPVDLTNCGRTLHFDRPPSRIVSGWPTSTDLLLELGAQKSVVGQYNTSTGTSDSAVPVLGVNAPSREQLLAAQPDLIWADGEYLFDGKQLPTIDDLRKQGIQVMILSGFCGDDATKARVRDIDTDLDALERILARPADAERLRAQVDRRLADVATRVAGKPPTPVAFLSSFDRQLYTYEGVYSDMAELAGATNIYAGTLPAKSYYGQISVEDLTTRNPGTLVYLLGGDETEAAARERLTKDLPTLAAVRENRIVFLPQNDSTNLAGIDGVEKLAAALHP